jgi:hypothetical protein
MKVLSLLATVLLCALPAVRAEAQPCTDAILSCGRSEVFEITNFKHLKQLGKSAAWVRRNCRLESSPTPLGCDWKGTLAGTAVSTYASATTVLDAGPGPAEPPPANRDPRGRIGPTPAPTEVLADTGIYVNEIAAAAERYRLPRHLIRAVMQVESGGNARAISGAGALGLMQLLPATATTMGVTDPYDPAQSIQGGARFLRVLANRFEGDLVKVLSAYHAGSTRVKGRDATPFAATDDYVRKVLKTYYQLRDAATR